MTSMQRTSTHAATGLIGLPDVVTALQNIGGTYSLIAGLRQQG